MRIFPKLSERLPKVHLYEDPSTKTLDLQEIARYLQDKFGDISVDVRNPLIVTNSEDTIELLARKLAETKVRDPMNSHVHFEPLQGEVEFERKLLRNPILKLTGVLYDGPKIQAVFQNILPKDEFNIEHTHIVFTNRLFGTFDEGDGRYHARVSIYSFPSLISTTGIVEAPAKPKGYYDLKQRYATLGAPVPLEELKEKFRGKFIDYDDERLTDVLKGYVMQALFYHLALEQFCDDKRCRLFNAHWQEDVLKSQLSQPEFCERHQQDIEKFKQQSR